MHQILVVVVTLHHILINFYQTYPKHLDNCKKGGSYLEVFCMYSWNSIVLIFFSVKNVTKDCHSSEALKNIMMQSLCQWNDIYGITEISDIIWSFRTRYTRKTESLPFSNWSGALYSVTRECIRSIGILHTCTGTVILLVNVII